MSGTAIYADPALRKIDAAYFTFDALDADRFEHLIQGYPYVAQIGFIIAHPDAVPCVSVNHRYFDFACIDIQLIELARGVDSASTGQRIPRPE